MLLFVSTEECDYETKPNISITMMIIIMYNINDTSQVPDIFITNVM